jgi:tetratricopeptide (TPR) repeat protein
LFLFLITSLSRADTTTVNPDGIVVQNPHYGEVLFYFYQDDYFPAIVRLLSAQQQQQLNNHLEQSELLLGGMYLSYGQHLDAADIFHRLLADNVQPEIRDRTWFFLAKIWIQRGYLDKAEDALERLSDDLPDNLRREAQMLHGQILIDTGRYGEAIALLAGWQGKTEWASYAKFNLGVALVRNGDVDTGAGILDELGNIDASNEELTSLRDKANVALGYSLLQDGQAASAKQPLQRVRLNGPFSNKALLGVGWADAEMENYRRALVPWMELGGRDLLDPAVQESMLAIPYALGKLDSISQAADHYVNAIEAFYDEINRIDRAIGFVEAGNIFEQFLAEGTSDGAGARWRIEQLPEGPEVRYLYHLLASHEFQEGLKNYRDLSYLQRNLDTWQQNVDVYGNMLDTRRQAYEQRLPRAEDALERADIESLIDRKLEFDSVLDNIEQSSNWLALATEREFEMWGDISSLERTPALSTDTPEAIEVRDKVQLLKGVLQWQLEREFNDRLLSIRRDLRQTGEELVKTQRLRRQIDDSMRKEPLLFDQFSRRVDDLGPRIAGVNLRVGDAMANQRAFLQSIAVGELQAQKQRLDIYTVQARFALAAIYDLAATVGQSSP